MARLITCGFETGADEGTVEQFHNGDYTGDPGALYDLFTIGSDTPTTYDSTISRTGKALRFDKGPGMVAWTLSSISGETDVFLRFWFRWSSTGDTIDFQQQIVRWHGTNLWRLNLNLDKTLTLGDNLGATDTSTTTIEPDTWYCISMRANFLSTGGTGSAKIYDSSGTELEQLDVTSTLTSGNLDIIRMGINTQQTGLSMWFDDVAINDASGTDENSWPSPVAKIVQALPVSDNARVGWTDQHGVTTNLYDAVNNVPYRPRSDSGAAVPPQVRTVNAVQSGAPGQNLDVTGANSGDIIIAVGESSEDAGYNLSGIENWAHVPGSPLVGSTGVTTLSVMWSRFRTGDADAALPDVGDHNLLRTMVISGCVPDGNPWDVTPTTAVEATSDTTAPYPNVTTTTNNCLILAILASSADSTTGPGTNSPSASLSSVTNRMNNGITTGNGGGIKLDTGIMATAGTVTGTNTTIAIAGSKAMMMLPLKPHDGKGAVKSLNSNTTDTYDANMTTYTDAGIGTNDTIKVVQPYMIMGNQTAATQRNVGIQMQSNPSGTEMVWTIPSAIAYGFPGGWRGGPPGTTQTPVGTEVVYNPSVTKGSSPVVRIRKATATTDAVAVALIGAAIEYEPGASGNTFTKQNIGISEMTSGALRFRDSLKTGIAVSPNVGSGVDSFNPTETGIGISTYIAAGLNANIFSELGTGISPFTGGGVSVEEAGSINKTGLGISPFVGSGTRIRDRLKAGLGIAPFVASALDSFNPTETGNGISPRVASGLDSFNPTETGNGISPRVGSGVDSFNPTETGNGISPRVGSGTDSFNPAELGTGISARVGSGIDSFNPAELGTAITAFIGAGTNANVFSEQNIAISPFVGSGTKMAERNKLGAGISARVALGADVVTFTETGIGIITFVGSGTKVLEGAPIIYTKAGIAIIPMVAAGTDIITFAKLGAGIKAHIASGLDSFNPAETGAGISARVSSATDTFTPVELGTGISPRAASGITLQESLKTGMGIRVFTASGLNANTFTELGMGVSVRVASGTDFRDSLKTGAGISPFIGSGAGDKVASRTGLAVMPHVAFGSDIFTAIETGTGIIVFSASGIDAGAFDVPCLYLPLTAVIAPHITSLSQNLISYVVTVDDITYNVVVEDTDLLAATVDDDVKSAVVVDNTTLTEIEMKSC